MRRAALVLVMNLCATGASQAADFQTVLNGADRVLSSQTCAFQEGGIGDNDKSPGPGHPARTGPSDGIDSLDEHADPERIGMLGGSRGAVNMFMAARHSRRLRALVSMSGVYDLAHEERFRPRLERVWEKHMAGYESNRENALEKRSVVQWVDELDINAPILILHGAFDERASATGALKFASLLQEKFRNYRLVMYERDDHFLTHNREAAHEQVIGWFERYLEEATVRDW